MQIRHHYVPQFYLKRFSIDTKPGVVWVYTRGKEPFQSHVTNIAIERHFYTVKLELTGEKSDQIEKMFSKIEGDTAPLFTRLANDSDIELSDDDLTLLSLFIAHLYNRGPAFRRKQYDFEILQRRKLIEFIAEDKDRFKKMTLEAGLTFEDEREAEDIRQRWLDIDNNFELTASGGEGSLIKLQLDLTEEIAPLIFHKRWHVLESSASDIFVTSDNPVTLISKHWIPGKAGKGFQNSSVVVPVTPSRCLLLTNGPVERKVRVVSANRKQVLEINANTMTHSYERVFSNINSAGIKTAFDKTKEYHSDQVYDVQFKVKPSGRNKR